MTVSSRRLLTLAGGALLCAACSQPAPDSRAEPAGSPPADPSSAAEAAVAATATAPLAQGSAVDAAFWPGADGQALLLAAAEISGVQVYAADGTFLGAIEGLEASHVAVLPASGSHDPLVVVVDGASSRIGAYDLDAPALTLTPRMAEPIAVNDEVTGLCAYVSPLGGNQYLYAVTDGGVIHHYELYRAGDQVDGRRLRTIPAGKGSGYCATDPRDGSLYLAQEHTGVWRLAAEPEADTALEPVDLREPFGQLSDDVKGVAVYPVHADLSYLLVADVGRERLAVYALPDGDYVGAARPDGLREPEGLAIALPGAGGGGLAAAADESTDGGGSNLKLIAWQDLTGALDLETAARPFAAAPAPAVVQPLLETTPLESRGDAADDPAIWVNPDDPSASRIIGTDKQSGLHVYDLTGQVQQYLPDGRMNNVDLRDGFPLAGQPVPLVAASNRSNDSVAIYAMDPDDGTLRDVAAGVLDTGFGDPYGLCLYHSAVSGEFYVFVNDGGSGVFRQWRLFDDGSGHVTMEPVREFAVGSQAEGCVADDATGRLYVAEEDVGLWRYSAEPDGGDRRDAIDATGDAGRLTDDVEGVALWLGPDDTGYLVASNQGADNYAVYRREGDNAFVGLFHVIADPAAGVDGASETDGLAVTSANLGGDLSDGMLVVQDGRNLAPEEGQNFKVVAWRDVMTALESTAE